jgi:hypothetical protein
MAKAKQVYIVQIQGWGDDEDEFYNMGTFSTRAKAEAGLEEMLQEWEDNGSDRDDVVYEIEEHVVA